MGSPRIAARMEHLDMQRRSFLRVSALTFTSLLGQAGCRGDGGGGGEGGSSSTGTGTGTDPGTSSGPGTSGDTGGREVVDAPERFPQSIASGDPRSASVILWTRVEDPERPDEDYDVELEIWPLDGAPGGGGGADDSGGEGGGPSPEVVMVVAEAAHDHCVKVRVEGLMAGTEYGYRFLYVRDEVGYASRSGQTKTAPSPDTDVDVRFAFVSCQDYGGRFYNAYAAMVEESLDFFVHLGDYIYETVGDVTFQMPGQEGRDIEFDDLDGAIVLTAGDGSPFYAARSLDNYRQLYRTVRSDAALQAAHERFAMIAVWDDHEFTNDSWGTVGTYSNGREDEDDPARRNAANQAWFEYMPVDYPDPDFSYDPGVAPPDDIRIYRDFEFGQHLHLVMTDLRSYRPDHLIPEDAYPGAVVMDEAALLTVAPDTQPGVPYVDIETYAGGMYVDLLRSVAEAGEYDPMRVTGNVSASYINDTIDSTGSPLPPIDAMELEMLPRGIAWHQMFKATFYGSVGSRYFVVRDPFMLYAAWRNAETGGAAQRLMGQEQEDWFLEVMQGSSRTWKVWGNEFCLTGLDIDLSGSALPDAFRQVFNMSTEDWNGAPHYRAEIIDALAGVDNVVAITGDIHAFYAGTPFGTSGATEGNRVVEFVTSSVSSGTYSSILVSQVQADPGLSSVPGIEDFALSIGSLLLGGPNPNMAYAETQQHGFAVVTARATELLVDYHLHPEDVVTSERYDDPSLLDEFSIERFRVEIGARELYRDFDGVWMRWDPTTRTWV